ncbi:MAG: helix-turn-helix domain-containing protein, partial [Balneola sp.]
RQGSPDNLPMVSNGEEKKSSSQSDFEHRDRELVYRALVELRTDISDVKKMLANFMYSTMSSKDIKALPPAMQSNMDDSDFSEMKININEHATLGMKEMPGEETDDENEVLESEESALVNFFGGEEIPSIESTEQFLIKQALDKYDGNRRRASETLGISERTLYRKLDQYGLA